MKTTQLSDSLLQCVAELDDAYAMKGQQIETHLEKLKYEKPLTYWDYIQLETLLTIQSTKTTCPDELIFISFHQTTELYFQLILSEIKQLVGGAVQSDAVFLAKLERISRYYTVLISSFEVITQGIDPAQFQKFRHALFPASGFQSVQYRFIELSMTDLRNLVAADFRAGLSADTSLVEMYQFLYWKQPQPAGHQPARNLTLEQFEEKYDAVLTDRATALARQNVWQRFRQQYADSPLTGDMVTVLKQIDRQANVLWPSMHYRGAVKHLRTAAAANGTGSTEWKKYLSPKNQRIMFFPDLWSADEKEHWGQLD